MTPWIGKKTGFALCGLFFSSYLALIFCTFKDYGITWDEYIGHSYGQHIINYYSTLFRDQTATTYVNVYLYGGFFETLCVLFSKITAYAGMGVYEARHLLNALMGFMGIYYAFLLGTRISGSRGIGLLSALFLFFMPRYFGHSFNNSKDIPFAALYLATLYYICDSVPHWEKKLPGSSIAKIGISSGLCIGTRVGGGALLLYFASFLAGYRLILSFREKTALKSVFFSVVRDFLPTAAISYATMLLFWPWAQQNPLVNPWISSKIMLNFSSTFSTPTLFEGVVIPSAQTPWYYLPKWFLISTPFFILLGLLFLGTQRMWAIWHGPSREKKHGTEKIPFLLLVMSCGFPLLMAMLFRTKFYDGIRHSLFLLPLAAILSAAGYGELYRFLAKWSKNNRVRLSVNLFCFLFMGFQFAFMTSWYVRSHPNSFIFFNSFIGGIRGAYRNYPLEYWGNSHKQAAQWLNAYVSDRHAHRLPSRKYRVHSYENPLSVQYYLDPKYFQYNFEDLVLSPLRGQVPAEKEWDFLVVSRDLHVVNPDYVIRKDIVFTREGVLGKEVHRICIDGIPIAAIFKLEKPGDGDTRSP